MIKIIKIKEGVQLKDYDLYSSLAMALRELNREASALLPRIQGKKIWMVNSTSQGGGAAEMMPRVVSFLRQLGINCDWVVASAHEKEYYQFTKKIHNLIHGVGEPIISEEEKSLYEKVNKENAEELLKHISPNDIVIIHDPQPLAIGFYLKQKINVRLIWRCHIGLDKRIPQTITAWEFLKNYLDEFEHSLFSATEYIPGFLTGKASVMHPTIDPLDHKNRDLPVHKIVGILCNSNLLTEYQPVLTPPFTDHVKKLQSDGSFQSPLHPTDAGLLFKPVVLQVSRWDRLKGYLPLMKGFEELKKNKKLYAGNSIRNLRRLEIMELVLAGPDPDFVEDDPEGKEVLHELSHHFRTLPPIIQNHISILKLPMTSRKQNNLIVNALQRLSTVVVQNSIREGFGLTVTEAMWKVKPVLGSSACGIKQQIREGIDGRIIQNPEDIEEIAHLLNHALSSPKEREVWGYNAQKMVIENFLIFTQIRNWLQIFAQ